jgi:hypothetical protein
MILIEKTMSSNESFKFVNGINWIGRQGIYKGKGTSTVHLNGTLAH